MLTWASLALAVLKLVNTIMGYLDRDALIKSGYDKAIADVGQDIMGKTAAGKAILERVNAMSNTEVDDALRGLEPH
jgi:hypothetical protein